MAVVSPRSGLGRGVSGFGPAGQRSGQRGGAGSGVGGVVPGGICPRCSVCSPVLGFLQAFQEGVAGQQWQGRGVGDAGFESDGTAFIRRQKSRCRLWWRGQQVGDDQVHFRQGCEAYPAPASAGDVPAVAQGTEAGESLNAILGQVKRQELGYAGLTVAAGLFPPLLSSPVSEISATRKAFPAVGWAVS